MGTDKGLLVINHEPFVKHIWNTVKTITPSVFTITSNKKYTALGLNCIEDIYPNKGPVGGIQTALNHSSNEIVVIISCDAPFVSSDFLKWLVNEHQKSNAGVTFPALAGKEYPLIGVYNKSLENFFLQAIQQEQLKLMYLLNQQKCNIIKVPTAFENNIHNINTKEEYHKLLNNDD
jgi:molybdopterin-guanine dinucleotide biosynthesis protein A